MWARFDDHYADHPKIVQCGPLAAWLNTAAITYCSRYLTDGFVPEGAVRCLANFDGIGMMTPDGWQPVNVADLVARLVTHRVWDTCAGGYRIHDYLDYNPSADQVKREREAKAERAAKWRSKQKRTPDDGKPSERDAARGASRDGAANAASMGAPYPYPIETPSTNVEGARPAKKAQTPKASASAKPRDPNLDHPAVKLYRDMVHLTPDECQRAEIAAQVADAPKWQAVIRAWLLHGNKKGNVQGMLDWYREGIPTYRNMGNGPTRKTAPPAASPRREPDDYDNKAAIARI